jgi:hypothetical protein
MAGKNVIAYTEESGTPENESAVKSATDSPGASSPLTLNANANVMLTRR